MRAAFKGRLDQTRQIDRAQQTGPIGWQRLFPAGVRGCDGFAIAQIIGLIDPIDENHSRLGKLIGRLHNLIPELARRKRFVNLPFKHQIPIAIRLHRRHKRIRYQHRNIEHAQPRRIRFRSNKIFNIGVITAQCGHHRATARSRAHNGAAHTVPDIHERERPRCICSHALDQSAFGADRAKIIPDPSALLHGQRGFLEHIKNTTHIIGHRAHHKAIEQRDFALRPGASGNPPGGQKFKIFQSGVEFFFPNTGLGLNAGQILGNAPPALFDARIDRFIIRRFQPIFHIPNLFGNRCRKSAHIRSFGLWAAAPLNRAKRRMTIIHGASSLKRHLRQVNLPNHLKKLTYN